MSVSRTRGFFLSMLRVNVRSKIDAVRSDSGLNVLGLSRFFFNFLFTYARRVRVRNDSGRVQILGPKNTSSPALTPTSEKRRHCNRIGKLF